MKIWRKSLYYTPSSFLSSSPWPLPMKQDPGKKIHTEVEWMPLYLCKSRVTSVKEMGLCWFKLAIWWILPPKVLTWVEMGFYSGAWSPSHLHWALMACSCFKLLENAAGSGSIYLKLRNINQKPSVMETFDDKKRVCFADLHFFTRNMWLTDIGAQKSINESFEGPASCT